MLMTTTSSLDGRPVRQYLGVVNGEAIIGANLFKDMFASIRNVVGGRAGSYERTLADARRIAMEEMEEDAKKLGANAVIITEEGYGNPDTDFCLNAKLHEDAGIVAIVISDEAAGIDGKSQSTADATPELVSFVSTGNVNEMLEVPSMQKVIGDARAIANLSGGAAESLRPDGSMYIELQAIIASTCEIGFSRNSCEWI